MSTIRTLLLLASPILCAACGGATAERNAPDGGHRSSTAASGGSSALPGAGGHAPSGQGGQGAVDSFPMGGGGYVSPPFPMGDSVPPPGGAPGSGGCVSVNGECKPDADVPPVIDGGSDGEGGSNIDGGSCTGGPMRQIHYVSRNPDACNAIRYSCPANTDYYGDEYCGCGCIQDPDCPVFVDCEPTAPPSPRDPLCTDTARCPYTQRAF